MYKRINNFCRYALFASTVFGSSSALGAVGEFDDSTGVVFGAGSSQTSNIALQDLNADGLPDVFVTNYNQLHIYHNDGTGGFSSLNGFFNHTNPSRAQSMATNLADYDGDGDLDVTVAYAHNYYGSGKENLLLVNNGSGQFTRTTFGTGNAHSMTSADFNGDGLVDILVNNANYQISDGSIVNNGDETDYLWINNGNMQFTATVFPAPTPDTHAFYTSGDVDGDGDNDVIYIPQFTGNSDIYTYLLFKNDGSGVFTQQNLFDAVGIYRLPTLVDTDGDGDLDLFLAGAQGGTSPFWENDGTGQFTDNAAAIDTSDGSVWTSFETTFFDADDDGDLDAFNIPLSASKPSLWLNNGQGVYSASAQVITPLAYRADAGDVDGDGFVDVVTTISTGNKIWINAGEPPLDTDADGVLDGADNCPLVANVVQFDADKDGLGDACDADNDNDGLDDATADLCLFAQSSGVDFDNDGIGDVCDSDWNNDGIAYDSAFEPGFDIEFDAAVAKGWKATKAVESVKYYLTQDNGRVVKSYIYDPTSQQHHVVLEGDMDFFKTRQSFFYATTDTNGEWQEEQIKSLSQSEIGPSELSRTNHVAFALSPSGVPHALITHQTLRDEENATWDSETLLAVRNNGVWELSVVAELANASAIDGTDMQFDSAGLLHVVADIAHVGTYLTWNGTVWTKSLFESGVYWPQLAVANDDSVHIVHATGGGGTGLQHVLVDTATQSFTKTSVFNRTINPLPNAGWDFAGYYPELSLDTNNQPHVAYMGADGRLGYSYLTGSTWQHIASDVVIGMSIGHSFTLDANDVPHIAYRAPDNGETGATSSSQHTRYAKFDGSTWVEEMAYSLAPVGKVALQVDEQGTPFILSYKRYPSATGAGWAGNIYRDYMPQSDTWWEGVLLLQPDTAVTSAVDEQRYVLVADGGFNDAKWQHFYLTFSEFGIVDTVFPRDLDIVVAKTLCFGSSCNPTDEAKEIDDYRATSTNHEIAKSGTAIAQADFNNDQMTDYIAVGENAAGETIVELQKKLIPEKNGFYSRMRGYDGYPARAQVVDTLSGQTSQYKDATAADFNSDAHADFVLTDSILPGVRVYFGSGDFAFQSALEISTSFVPAGVDAEDVNGDGKADFVIASADGSGKVAIFVANGDGTFNTIEQTLVTDTATIAGIALADFDRDNTVDIVLVNATAGVAFYKGLGNMLFEPNPVVSLDTELGAATNEYRGIDNDFLSHDIDMDLIMTNPLTKSAFVLKGLGNGQFTVLDQQYANYIDFTVARCEKESLTNQYGVYEFEACLQDPTIVEKTAWMEWGANKPQGVSAFPYHALVAPVVPIAPVANAGEDQSVHIGDLVTLDGAASSDPDENYPLLYHWVLIDTPVGSQAALTDASTINPTLFADVEGDFVIRLEVTDQMGILSAADTVIISTFNTAPIADAGDDQSISLIGEVVYLDGSQSVDPDGDEIAFQWQFESKPEGSSATLSDVTSATPTFTADVNGSYVLSLTVEDVWSYSDASDITVSFLNIAPIADAGLNQSLLAGDLVQLTGAASSDVNNDTLSYQWTFVALPEGSAAEMSDDQSEATTFIADVAGEYVVSLVVNDGIVSSPASNISIVAIALSDALTQKIQSAIDLVNSYDNDVFKRKAKNKRNKLVRRLSRALKRIDKQKFVKAQQRLEMGVLTKLDGCRANNVPDKKDWIIDCDAQQAVETLILDATAILQQINN